MYDLRGVRALYKYIERDPKVQKLRFIHAAGTNGKGTFCSKVAKSIELANAGIKVGLYTSPHISSLRERIVINGEKISKEAIVEFYNFFAAKKLADPELSSTSFFDFTTVLALHYFSQ